MERGLLDKHQNFFRCLSHPNGRVRVEQSTAQHLQTFNATYDIPHINCSSMMPIMSINERDIQMTQNG
jgi:hypothetical protein